MSNPVGAQRYGLGGGDAYYDAVKYGGYTGTREQFGRDQAEFAQNATAVAQAREEVERNTQTVVNTAQMFTEETVPAAIQSVEEKGDTEEDRLEARTTELVQSINTAGAVQVQAVEDEGTEQIGLVSGAGTAQVEAVEQAGSDQVDAVEQAGADQVQAVTDEGTTQIGAVIGEGDTQVQRVQDKGDEVLESIPDDYSVLNQEVNNLKTALSEIPLTFIDGYYVSANNIPVANAQYSYSEYVKVVAGEKLHIVNYFHDEPRMVFVNESKMNQTASVVEAIANTAAGTFLYDSVITVPDGAAYLRISCKTDSTSKAKITRLINVSIDKMLNVVDTSYTKVLSNWKQGIPAQPQNKNRVSIYTGKSDGGKLIVTVGTGLQYAVDIYDSEYYSNLVSTSGFKQIVTITEIPVGFYAVVVGCKTNYGEINSSDASGIHVTYIGETKNAIQEDNINNLIGQNGLKNEFIVPDYYIKENYLDGKIVTINDIAKSSFGNGDVFAFITDMHWRLNAKHSPALLNYLFDKTHINKLFGGGDYANTKSNDDSYYEVGTILRDAWHGDAFYAIGNHEYLGSLGTGNITRNSHLAYYFEGYYGNKVVYGSKLRNYFYIDNNGSKIRYIFLARYDQSTDGGANATQGLEAEQITWFNNVALNLESGWGAIVVIHALYEFNIIDETTITPYLAAIPKQVADSIVNYSGNGEIIAVISGHSHLDIVLNLSNGVPVIVTTCDKNKSGGESSTFFDSYWAEREDGTIKEQAFDIMAINRADRKITAVRIGCPAMTWTQDGNNYIRGSDVEQREISY